MSKKTQAVACAAIFLTVLLSAARADSCYVLKNNSKGTVVLNFNYSGPVAEHSPVRLELQAGGVYPSQGQWCWKEQGYTATMSYGAPVKQSWNGVLVLGVGGFPSGTYVLSDNSAPTPAPAQACLPNPYPGAANYCLKSVGRQVQANCGIGNAHRNGSFTTMSGIQIVCHNGKSWQLTCLKDGTGCNLSDHEFCVGFSQWNVGQHCTEKSDDDAPANGNWKP